MGLRGGGHGRGERGQGEGDVGAALMGADEDDGSWSGAGWEVPSSPCSLDFLGVGLGLVSRLS